MISRRGFLMGSAMVVGSAYAAAAAPDTPNDTPDRLRPSATFNETEGAGGPPQGERRAPQREQRGDGSGVRLGGDQPGEEPAPLTFFYGHVCSHTRTDAIITDGLFTRDLITALYWQEREAGGVPRLEILAHHGTDWGSGQRSHPHCHVSPDGRWLSYNRAREGRSDACVVRIG